MKIEPIHYTSLETTRSRFNQILHHCSMSWKITALCFLDKKVRRSVIFKLLSCWEKIHQIPSVMFETTIFEKLICCFKNDKNLVKFVPNTRNSQKFALFSSPYSAKYLKVDLKSTEELSFMTLKSDSKFELVNLWFGKWHEEYSKFSPEHLKVSKLGL